MGKLNDCQDVLQRKAIHEWLELHRENKMLMLGRHTSVLMFFSKF